MHRKPNNLTLGSVALVFGALAQGCSAPQRMPQPPRPDVRPEIAKVSDEVLQLDDSQIVPMYTELLPIDLDSVVWTASAENLDILKAREAVEASAGRYESTINSAFPAIVPTALFSHVEGSVRATEGNIVNVGFDTFEASVALQWIVNPGRVINDIVAAKKRLAATEHRELAIQQETVRRAAIEYYALVLAQARIAAAHQGVLEAEELARINRLKEQAGTGVTADRLRAEAQLARRQQDLIVALADFYHRSLDLAVTLRLDPTVTLVPSIDELPPIELVRDDLSIEELLGIAVAFRSDLAAVRELVEAASADHESTWWSGFGPEIALSYEYGGIMGHANNIEGGGGIPSNLIVNPTSPTGTFGSSPFANGVIKEGIQRGSARLDSRSDQSYGFSERQRGLAGAAWRLSLATFGELKTDKAVERTAVLEAQRLLETVGAQVVSAAQDRHATSALIGVSRQEVEAADEALRLSEAHLESGAMTTLDVLQSQEAASRARLAYAEAVVRFNQAHVELLAALGLMSPDSILRNPPQTDDTENATKP